MKSLPLFALAAFAASAAVHAAAAPKGLRYTIAVVKFDNLAKSPVDTPLADSWGACLTDALQRSGRFIVIGESDLRAAALAEQEFVKSGRAATGEGAPEIRNMTPAQLLIKGEITHFQDGVKGSTEGVGFAGFTFGIKDSTAEINVVIYIVDATTGMVVASQKVVGISRSHGVSLTGDPSQKWSPNLGTFRNTNVGKAVEAAVDQAVAFCAQQVPKLPWRGAVVLVRDGRVYVNRGEREGVAAGDLFRVGQSETLRDPSTGETLDSIFTEKGRLRVELAKEKLSICSIVSGAGIEPGMSIAPVAN